MSEEVTTNNINENRNLRDKKNINYFEDSNNNDEDDNSYFNDEEIEKEKDKMIGSKRKRKQKKEINNNDNNNNENNNNEKKLKFNTSSKKEKNTSTQNNSNKKKKDEFNFENIINIKDLSIKETPLLNSEIILTILEICLNSSKYGLQDKDNSSRSFWDKISDIKEINFLVKNFKPETLRKYWRKLRSAKKYKNIINAVNENADKINNKEIKLLSSINAISDYSIMPNKGFDYYLNKYCININNKKNKDKKEDPEEHIEKIVKDLSKIYTDISKEEIYDIINSVKGKVEDADEILKKRTKEIEEIEKQNIKNEEEDKLESNNDNINDNNNLKEGVELKETEKGTDNNNL